MKRIILMALLGFALYKYATEPAKSIDVPPPRLSNVPGGEQVMNYEFMALFESGTGFADLAEPGHYTVFETYLDSCGVCRELESGFPQFTAARPDVRLVRVRVPEGGFSFWTSTEEELESIRSRLDRLGNGCTGTPFIQIYGPDGKLMISDRCKGGRHPYALEALRKWMATESSSSPS